MRRTLQILGVGAVLAGTLALTSPAAADDWRREFMAEDFSGVSWFFEWRDNNRAGTDVRYGCYNTGHMNDVRCEVVDKEYECADGYVQRSSGMDIGRAGPREYEFSSIDYGRCEDHGGVVRVNWEHRLR